MAPYPNLLPLAGFVALMIAAVVIDFRRLVIPNGLVAGLCILWLLHVGSARGVSPVASLETVAAAAAALAAGAVLFSRGLIGGGDVKLFAAASLWTGAAALPQLLLLTALLGGALALLFLSPLGLWLTAAQRIEASRAGAGSMLAGHAPIPYGVAIAAAALIVTISPYLD
ncbi:MAG: A24 family peptidase [Stellaceae bacterium]